MNCLEQNKNVNQMANDTPAELAILDEGRHNMVTFSALLIFVRESTRPLTKDQELYSSCFL